MICRLTDFTSANYDDSRALHKSIFRTTDLQGHQGETGSAGPAGVPGAPGTDGVDGWPEPPGAGGLSSPFTNHKAHFLL